VFNNREDTSHSWFSIVLVATQFLLVVLIMFAGPLWPTYWGLKGMMVLGGVIGLWAFLTMGLRNLRAFPEIPQHGRLVVHGPYRWVRHPMYTSVLLITLTWMVEQPFPFRMVLWVGLVVTLWVKLRYEEQLLLARFPLYEEYRMRTKRVIPFLF
jgi:protein-S-isoprenylcysteine O-methyltransferase Ste14